MSSIVGYVYRAAVWCEICMSKVAEKRGIDLTDYDSCSNHEVNPISATDETGDSPDNCTCCHSLIGSSFSPSTVKYVLDAVRESIEEKKSDSTVRKWAERLHYCGISKKEERLLARFEQLPHMKEID